MVKWLKFFFLSYFSNRYAREAAERRFLNLLLALVLSIVLIFGGLATGYRLSFGAHYKKASEFKEFAYAAFAGDAQSSVPLSVDDGILSTPQPAQTVNSFANGEYSLNGYMLIIDARPRSQTYAEFEAYCREKDGERKIAYSEWLELSETDREQYPTFGIEYKPTSVDISSRRGEYESYFESIKTADEKTYEKYAELSEKTQTGELGKTDYECALYELYIAAYYPSLAEYESYGNAPTLKTYYLNTVKTAECAKYLIMFRDEMYASFFTDGGISVRLDGKYGIAYSCSITPDTSRARARDLFDGLISSVFERGLSLDTTIYMINVLMALPWILIAFVACALLLSVALRFAKHDCSGFIDSCKTVGAFLFVSGVTAFVFGWVISYFAAREMSFQLTILVYAIVFAVRTVVYAITEIVRCRKNNARIADVEPIAATRLTPIPITHEAPPADDPFDPFDETRQDAENSPQE